MEGKIARMLVEIVFFYTDYSKSVIIVGFRRNGANRPVYK